MSPKFVISMLALDNLALSKACIQSILENSTSGIYRLFLTNNASKDGTKEYFDTLSQKHDFITVIHNEQNEVFITPNNRVFEEARKLGAIYNITINNDIVVPPEWLEKLERQFILHPTAAIVGPRGTTSQLNRAMIGNSAAKLEFIEGSLMCSKISVLEKFGPLFSDYLIDVYHDDSDASLRVQRAGYSIHQADFVVSHRNGSTCTKHPDAIARCRAANTKNQQTMLKKWAHWNLVRRFDFQIIVKRRFAVGDVLLTTPIIRALKKLWPLCPIDVETGAPDIFKGNPHVRRAGTKIGLLPGALVIDLNGAYEKTPQIPVLHSYARAAGLEVSTIEPYLDLFFNPSDCGPLPEGRWAALHVGPTTWPGRTWPLDRWAQVADRLRSAGWKIALFGEKNKSSIYADADFRGQSGFQELAGLILQCRVFIGLDSFPSHVAAAVCTPAVVLYGVTDPLMFTVNTGPFVAVCSDPAHPDTGKRNKIPGITFMHTTDACMRTISVEQVIKGVKSLIQDSNL